MIENTAPADLGIKHQTNLGVQSPLLARHVLLGNKCSQKPIDRPQDLSIAIVLATSEATHLHMVLINRIPSFYIPARKR